MEGKRANGGGGRAQQGNGRDWAGVPVGLSAEGSATQRERSVETRGRGEERSALRLLRLTLRAFQGSLALKSSSTRRLDATSAGTESADAPTATGTEGALIVRTLHTRVGRGQGRRRNDRWRRDAKRGERGVGRRALAGRPIDRSVRFGFGW